MNTQEPTSEHWAVKPENEKTKATQALFALLNLLVLRAFKGANHRMTVSPMGLRELLFPVDSFGIQSLRAEIASSIHGLLLHEIGPLASPVEEHRLDRSLSVSGMLHDLFGGLGHIVVDRLNEALPALVAYGVILDNQSISLDDSVVSSRLEFAANRPSLTDDVESQMELPPTMRSYVYPLTIEGDSLFSPMATVLDRMLAEQWYMTAAPDELREMVNIPATDWDFSLVADWIESDDCARFPAGVGMWRYASASCGHAKTGPVETPPFEEE